MIPYTRKTLPNGLTVVVNRDRASKLAAVNILYRVGARNENPARTGFAHLFEHLMFRGTREIPNFDLPVQMACGDNNAFTNNDYTDFYITLPKDNIETALWLEADRMTGLDISPEALETEKRVVIEEFLTGPEVSVLAFTDGKTVKPMVSSMDHKRALDHDEGLNTGGMGTIAPNPCYTPELARRCMDEIFLPTIAAMNAEGRTFTGCLYFGLMMTPKGPKVIEYNCRFGDPETQVVLPLLKSDLLTIMRATVDGTLADTPVEFTSGAACCVVLASGGYPVSYKSGYPISGLDEAGKTATVFHAGTKLVDGQIVTAGGRVLGVTATADTLEAAIDKAYQAADKITFTDMHMRRDIGQRALASRKESHS